MSVQRIDYKIVPVVQLAAHAKSSTLYGRSYGRTVVRKYGRRVVRSYIQIFFGFMGYYYSVLL